MKKAKVIAVTNQKGGTGKTTTSLFLTYGLADRGKHVLLIDLDQQADASFLLNSKYNDGKTTFELLTGDSSINDIITSVNHLIDLAPASDKLAQLDVTLMKGKKYFADILRKALKPVLTKYDYIIIDTPPALSMAVTNALTAADDVVIPVQADVFSIKGLADLANTINKTKSKANPELHVAGIVIGLFKARTVYSKAAAKMIEDSAKELHMHMFKTRIRQAIAVPEAEHQSKSIFEYDKRGKVTKDVNNFIDELLEELNNE